MGEKLPYNKKLFFLSEDEAGEEKLFLSEKKIEDIRTRIEVLIGQQKTFLKTHYTLARIAEDISIPYYQLSAFVNLILKQRYNDLINQYRINYCLELLRDKKNGIPKVHELANACGFGNRNTFINAFKKYVHTTPIEYLNQLKGGQPKDGRSNGVPVRK